jgi:hypothetical protein
MKSLVLMFFLVFFFFEPHAKTVGRQKKAVNSACRNKHSKACFRALSAVDPNRVKTHIATKEQARLHREIQERKGIKSPESSSLLKTMQKVSCNMATNNLNARAYCYEHCIDSDDCQIKNNKKR